MADYRRSEIVSGLFIVLAVAVFGLFAFNVGGFELPRIMRGESLVCYANFTNVSSLEKGAKVSVGGRLVGKVTKLSIAEEELTQSEYERMVEVSGTDAFPGLEAGMKRQVVEVEFELTDETLKLDAETARVSLVQDGLLGTHYLTLDPGYWRDAGPETIFMSDLMTQDDRVEIKVRGSGGLDELIAAARPIVKKIDAAITKLNEEILRDLSGILSENRADVAEIVRRLRRTMWQAEMAARKIRANPSVVIWGDDEPDLEAIEIDESGIRRTGRARPYRQRDESDDGK